MHPRNPSAAHDFTSRFIGDDERWPEPHGDQEQNKQAGFHEGILLAKASLDCLDDILGLPHWLGATVEGNLLLPISR